MAVRMVLNTPLCDRLGISVPIFLAGMGRPAGPELAAAVSNAGGLGVIGATRCEPAEIRERIKRTRELTDKPFGVDLILPAKVSRERQTVAELQAMIPQSHRRFVDELRVRFNLADDRQAVLDSRALGTDTKAQLEVILEEKPPVFVSGLGNPGFMIPDAHSQDMIVMAVVGSVRSATEVAAAGVDVVIAQGAEGGGHTGTVGTFVLLPQVIDSVAPVPVLAAGGIADGRGVAAALVLGCAGVWVGTRFLASKEAEWPEWKKDSIVAADERSTKITRSYTGKPIRSITNEWIDAWEQADIRPLPMPLQSALVAPLLAEADSDPRVSSNPAGQGAALVKEKLPAAEIVSRLVNEAQEAISPLIAGQQ